MGVAISMAVHLSCDQEDTFESPNDISRDLTITLPRGCARNCARVDPTQSNSGQDRGELSLLASDYTSLGSVVVVDKVSTSRDL